MEMNEADRADMEQEERDLIFSWPDPPTFAVAADEPHDLPITEDPQPTTPRALLGVPGPMPQPVWTDPPEARR